MRVCTVVGARPQFVKIAPLVPLLDSQCDHQLVHTGQHFDYELSGVFFDELGIRRPNSDLGVNGGSHASQTAGMLVGLEREFLEFRPDYVVVIGDTNSTLAGALAAAKLNIAVAHLEAGLRSFNRRMPEEVNRVLVDHVSTLLFAPSQSAADLLYDEGVTEGVHVVGDIMHDVVLANIERATKESTVLEANGLRVGEYVLATIHRAENADDPARLRAILHGLASIGAPVLLPLHPRTRLQIQEHCIDVPGGVSLVAPLGYLDLLAALAASRVVVTDSGGLQKEAYYAGIPCVTIRDETEWRETIATGWNVLVGADSDRLRAAVQRFAEHAPGERPSLYGRGDTAYLVASVLLSA